MTVTFISTQEKIQASQLRFVLPECLSEWERRNIAKRNSNHAAFSAPHKDRRPDRTVAKRPLYYMAYHLTIARQHSGQGDHSQQRHNIQ